MNMDDRDIQMNRCQRSSQHFATIPEHHDDVRPDRFERFDQSNQHPSHVLCHQATGWEAVFHGYPAGARPADDDAPAADDQAVQDDQGSQAGDPHE